MSILWIWYSGLDCQLALIASWVCRAVDFGFRVVVFGFRAVVFGFRAVVLGFRAVVSGLRAVVLASRAYSNTVRNAIWSTLLQVFEKDS